LVLFLPVEVVYFAEDLAFHQNSVKKGMKFLGKFYRNRYWVLGAKLPNVIAGRNIVYTSDKVCDVWGFIFSKGRIPIGHGNPSIAANPLCWKKTGLDCFY